MHAMELSSSGFLHDTTHTGAGSDGAGAEETFDRVTLCLDESPAASVQLPVQTFSRPRARDELRTQQARPAACGRCHNANYWGGRMHFPRYFVYVDWFGLHHAMRSLRK